MTGLIIGSMAPDFEKFIRMRAFDAYSHTWKSIFYFSLPVALILAFLFHLIVRDVLIEHLPAFLQRRLIKLRNFDWVQYFRNHYGMIILSIITGTVSHIAWDAFTHADGRFVKWLPFLQKPVTIRGIEMQLYSVLQLGFSILGLIIVIYAFFHLPALPVRNTHTSAVRKLRYWIVFTLIAFFIFILRYVIGNTPRHLPDFIVIMISAGLLSLLITSSLFKKYMYPSSVHL